MTGTVRDRLLRLVALLLFPSLAIAVLLTWKVYATAREGAETALREAAHGLGQLVDREFVESEVLLRTLAATGELQRGDMAEFGRLARATVVLNGAIVLTNSTGQELVDTALPEGAKLPLDAPLQSWAGEVVGETVILPATAAGVHRSPGGLSKPAVEVVLPVGVRGRHAYDLKLVLPSRSLQAILLREKLPPGWISGIMDPTGIVAARVGDPERYIGRMAGPELMGALAHADEGARDAHAFDGTPVVLAFSRSAQTRWTVAVASPRTLVVQAGRQSTTLLGLLGTVAILAGVIAARRVASNIARPVEALAQSARALGESGTWTPIREGLAEADAVASALQTASRTLAEREAALTELNANLAARVEARTRELADANTALDAQRRGLADILDQMPVGVLVHAPDRSLLLSNVEARRLMGVPVSEEPAQPVWPILRQGTHTLPQDETPTALACNGITAERVLVSIDCGGGQGGAHAMQLEISARPLQAPDGTVLVAVTVFQDVTARIEAEEARRRSQRLEAVGQLTGGVAHEFNNLLLAVTGCLELLAKPVARLSDPRATALLANASRAAGRGSRLTTQLLAFARRQTLQIERLDLKALVAGMRELLEGTLGRTVQVVVDHSMEGGEPSDCLALADASQVELMLLNLAINARDAMPGGGTLTIRTACEHAGPPRRAEDPPEGDYAVLHVTDTGHGMPPHVLARAFEPFFTTKDVGRGSGLGLAQVLGVAQQMGGGVTIVSQTGTSQPDTSQPHRGTTVSVYLPHSPGDAAAPARPVAERPDAATLGGIRVLVVDDDADVRVVTTAILEELGAQVSEADSAAAALLAVRTTAFDLILADLTMPNMSGQELAREVTELFPDLPVVLMTGYGPAALADPGPNIRATLQKPFRAGALARVIATVLGQDHADTPAATGAAPQTG
jgi:signal transduction histidine kinase/ActR/RegA family two-component response regulator/phage tail protein X